MDILIIDGQGGNLGRQLTKRLREAVPQADITVVGTNSTATENMLKGGADRAATGENAVIVNANKEGLLSLANILTALSRETASGAHVHLDQYNSLEDGSTELIIVKND